MRLLALSGSTPSNSGSFSTRVNVYPESRNAGASLIAIYALSGLTGLAYEVLWARMLSLQFGVSIFGVIAVTVAFMGGLGGGGFIGAAISRKFRRPLYIFATLEAGVATFALAMPWILAFTDHWLSLLASQTGVGLWYLIYGAALTVLLSLPAVALGIGFPLFLTAASPFGLPLARVYGWNTVGGAVGALLPLVLLPTLGWLSATQAIAFVGLTVAGGAFFLQRGYPRVVEADRSETKLSPGLTSYAAYAGVGMASLMLEVGWTRLFGMVLLRTEYVLAVLLAVFLVGIGLGSLLAKRIGNAERWIEAIPVVAGLAALGSLWALPWISAWAEASDYSSLASALILQGGALALITLPVTLALGLWLPLLTARFGNRTRIGARLYAVNSLGAAVGALTAGLLLIPLVGTAATLCLAAGLLWLCGQAWSTSRWRWLGAVVIVALAWPVWQLAPVNRLLPEGQGQSRDLFVYEDAVSITHVTEDANGQRLLLADLQRMDASSEPSAVESQRNQGRLPLLMHPEPKSVLFLGLGTGISAAGSLPFPGLSRTAVELSKGAIEAAHTWFAPVNDGVMDKLTLYRDDARHFLRSSSDRYDVIIGDLFHPDLAGRSALLSVQQFIRARDRLAEGGIFVQWLALNQFDPDSLAVVLRTFGKVFPQGALFVDGFRLAMVGPRDRLSGAHGLLANLERLDIPTRDAATGGEGAWSWLGRYWGRVPKGPGPVQDEWSPYIEFQLPKARYHGDMDLASLLEYLLGHRPSLQSAAAELGVPEDRRREFERAYIATDLAERSWIATIKGRSDEGQRLLRLAYDANPGDRWIGLALADRMLASIPLATARGIDEDKALHAILKVRPDYAEALRAVWHRDLAAGKVEEAAVFRRQFARVSPLDKEVRDANSHEPTP